MNSPISRRTVMAAGIGLACGGTAKGTEEKPANPPAGAKTDPSDILLSADKKYGAAKEAAQKDYRTELARAITLADKVQACLLNFEPDENGDLDEFASEDWFSILPYKQRTQILELAELDAGQIKEVCKLMADTVKSGEPGGGAACHFPIHGLRFFKGENPIYVTSFCWVCSNFYIQYPDDFVTAQWLGLKDDGLEKWMKKRLPIPEAELKRFKEKYPKALQ